MAQSVTQSVGSWRVVEGSERVPCWEPRVKVLLHLCSLRNPDGTLLLSRSPSPPRISEKFLPYPRHKDAVKKEKRFLEEM